MKANNNRVGESHEGEVVWRRTCSGYDEDLKHDVKTRRQGEKTHHATRSLMAAH